MNLPRALRSAGRAQASRGQLLRPCRAGTCSARHQLQKLGGRRWVRTTGISLVSKVRSVAGRCWKWPDVPSSCDDRGWESPGVARNLRSLALGLALGVATDCESPAAQPLQRLGRDAARIVLLVFAAELLHVLVVALGEHCPPGLAHARDHGDCRPGKPNAWQARRSCRSPVGRTAGAVHAQVRSGGSRTSHPSCRAWPSHLPSPENRGGGAAATASSTAVNCASMVPGQSSRNSSAGTVPSGARIISRGSSATRSSGNW